MAGYFTYKKWIVKQAKVCINTTLMKSKYGPLLTVKGDIELIVSSDTMEIEYSGFPITTIQ